MTVKDKVRAFIVESFLFGDGAELRNDDSLLGKGIIDSMRVLTLIAFLEEEFGISVADDEVMPENLNTVDRIVTFVDNKMHGSN
jgi:acyl carrier protein